MRTLTRPSELLRHPSRAFSRPSHGLEHPVLDVAGFLILALATVAFVSMLPDLLRYMRIRRM